MKKQKNKIIPFFMLSLFLIGLFFLAINIGSLQVTFMQLLRGLFVEFDPMVAAIYDLRFPRIFVAMLAGSAFATAGVLFQAVLKNPLADPGIIGVSSGASLMAMLITVFFPAMYFMIPFASLVGAAIAFVLVYLLAWQDGISPVHLILVGVAIDALFSGLVSSLGAMSGGALGGVTAIVNGNMTFQTWDNVNILVFYVMIGLILVLLQVQSCNYMALEDKTARGIGVDIGKRRLFLALTAVLLTGISAGIVGSIGFLGLIVPHMSRIIVGHDHKYLLPFSMLLGAFTLLLADTLGRVIMHPHEISANIIMAILGGPFFIFLLRRKGSKKKYVD